MIQLHFFISPLQFIAEHGSIQTQAQICHEHEVFGQQIPHWPDRLVQGLVRLLLSLPFTCVYITGISTYFNMNLWIQSFDLTVFLLPIY